MMGLLFAGHTQNQPKKRTGWDRPAPGIIIMIKQLRKAVVEQRATSQVSNAAELGKLGLGNL